MFKNRKGWLLAALLGLAACENPVQVRPEEHQEPAGVLLTTLDGGLIARSSGVGQAGGWEFPDGGDALRLAPGGSVEVEIWFFDADGEQFQLGGHDHEGEHGEEEEDHGVVVVVADTAVAAFEGHGDHGDFIGGTEGETTATIMVWHGEYPVSGHEDFVAPPLPIEVGG